MRSPCLRSLPPCVPSTPLHLFVSKQHGRILNGTVSGTTRYSRLGLGGHPKRGCAGSDKQAGSHPLPAEALDEALKTLDKVLDSGSDHAIVSCMHTQMMSAAGTCRGAVSRRCSSDADVSRDDGHRPCHCRGRCRVLSAYHVGRGSRMARHAWIHVTP